MINIELTPITTENIPPLNIDLTPILTDLDDLEISTEITQILYPSFKKAEKYLYRACIRLLKEQGKEPVEHVDIISLLHAIRNDDEPFLAHTVEYNKECKPWIYYRKALDIVGNQNRSALITMLEVDIGRLARKYSDQEEKQTSAM